MSISKARKIVDDSFKDHKKKTLDLNDKHLTDLRTEVPVLLQLTHLTRLSLAHNKLKTLPSNINDLHNLEHLNLVNNELTELPVSISSLSNLKVLTVAVNKLARLPRGFGAFASLQVLDLSYNHLSEQTLPANFFQQDRLRALYMADNEFLEIPEDICYMKQLQVLVFRDNQLISIPPSIGDLVKLKEFHVQGNRLTVLPPEMSKLDSLISPTGLASDNDKARASMACRLGNNFWVEPLQKALDHGMISHLFDYLRSEQYRYMYDSQRQAGPQPPPIREHGKKVMLRTA